jgi:uncharacterized membrane protein
MEEKIDRILEKVSELHSDMEVIKSEQRHLCSKVSRHDKLLLGNGVPGIKAQVWVMWGILVLVVTKASDKIFEIFSR